METVLSGIGIVLILLIGYCAYIQMAGHHPFTSPSLSGGGVTYQALARQDAVNAGIDPTLYEAQINEESGFNPNAVSPVGAIGIAQIMPRVAQSWQVDPHDPVASLSVAAQHMAWYQSHYGDYARALACYNAGCGTLVWAEQHCADYYWCLPRETQRYITAITGDMP